VVVALAARDIQTDLLVLVLLEELLAVLVVRAEVVILQEHT
jgi:hypothetical protein